MDRSKCYVLMFVRIYWALLAMIRVSIYETPHDGNDSIRTLLGSGTTDRRSIDPIFTIPKRFCIGRHRMAIPRSRRGTRRRPIVILAS